MLIILKRPDLQPLIGAEEVVVVVLVVVLVVEVEEVEPMIWLQGTGAEWQVEQEESLSEQLESNTHTLSKTRAELSYLAKQFFFNV